MLAVDSELLLVGVRIGERRVGDAMVDNVNLMLGHAVDIHQKRAAALGHHDQPRRKIGQPQHHPPMVGRGLAEDGVQRGNDRHSQVAQQGQNMPARRPAVEAVLVLQAYHVYVAEVEKIGRPAVRIEILLGKLEADFRRIAVAFVDVVHGTHGAIDRRILTGHRMAQVRGEGGNTAFARQIIADEGDFSYFRHSYHRDLLCRRGFRERTPSSSIGAEVATLLVPCKKERPDLKQGGPCSCFSR